MSSNLSTSSLTFVIISLFGSRHPPGCEVVSGYGYDLCPLDGWGRWASSHMLIGHLEKCLLKSFAHFKICLLLSCKSSLYILDTIFFLSDIWFEKLFLCKNSSQCVGHLYTFLKMSFETQKLFFWVPSNLFHFFDF